MQKQQQCHPRQSSEKQQASPPPLVPIVMNMYHLHLLWTRYLKLNAVALCLVIMPAPIVFKHNPNIQEQLKQLLAGSAIVLFTAVRADHMPLMTTHTIQRASG
jgi:hypothetical protein